MSVEIVFDACINFTSYVGHHPKKHHDKTLFTMVNVLPCIYHCKSCSIMVFFLWWFYLVKLMSAKNIYLLDGRVDHNSFTMWRLYSSPIVWRGAKDQFILATFLFVQSTFKAFLCRFSSSIFSTAFTGCKPFFEVTRPIGRSSIFSFIYNYVFCSNENLYFCVYTRTCFLVRIYFLFWSS